MKYLKERIVDTDIPSLEHTLHEQWQLEWSCLGKDLISFCNLMNTFVKFESILFQSHLLLHGQLAMVNLCLESMTPDEVSLHIESFGNFPVRPFLSQFVSKIHYLRLHWSGQLHILQRSASFKGSTSF